MYILGTIVQKIRRKNNNFISIIIQRSWLLQKSWDN